MACSVARDADEQERAGEGRWEWMRMDSPLCIAAHDRGDSRGGLSEKTVLFEKGPEGSEGRALGCKQEEQQVTRP